MRLTPRHIGSGAGRGPVSSRTRAAAAPPGVRPCTSSVRCTRRQGPLPRRRLAQPDPAAPRRPRRTGPARPRRVLDPLRGRRRRRRSRTGLRRGVGGAGQPVPQRGRGALRDPDRAGGGHPVPGHLRRLPARAAGVRPERVRAHPGRARRDRARRRGLPRRTARLFPGRARGDGRRRARVARPVRDERRAVGRAVLLRVRPDPAPCARTDCGSPGTTRPGRCGSPNCPVTPSS